MDRQQTIERLRIWAARARYEAQMADTYADQLKWQGQGQVLASVANLLADQTPSPDGYPLWRRVVADRAQALAAWQESQEGAEAMFHAGEVSGYDLALTAIVDVAGRVWPRIEPHVA